MDPLKAIEEERALFKRTSTSHKRFGRQGTKQKPPALVLHLQNSVWAAPKIFAYTTGSSAYVLCWIWKVPSAGNAKLRHQLRKSMWQAFFLERPLAKTACMMRLSFSVSVSLPLSLPFALSFFLCLFLSFSLGHGLRRERGQHGKQFGGDESNHCLHSVFPPGEVDSHPGLLGGDAHRTREGTPSGSVTR